MGKRCLRLQLVLHTAALFSVAMYSYLVHMLVELYASSRTPLSLTLLMLMPSQLLLAMLSVLVYAYTCLSLGYMCMAGAARIPGLRSIARLLVLLQLPGLAVSAALLAANTISGARAFLGIIPALSALHSAIAAAWLLLVLPATPLAYCAGRRARLASLLHRCWPSIVARWLLALAASSWATWLLRSSLAHVNQLLDKPLLYTETMDPALCSLQERILPRTVDLVLAPLWLTLLAHSYTKLKPSC